VSIATAVAWFQPRISAAFAGYVKIAAHRAQWRFAPSAAVFACFGGFMSARARETSATAPRLPLQLLP
jgi:hypothetical protein